MTSDSPKPVLLIRTKEGELIGSCTRHCYDNDDFYCSCICGGRNHGVGWRAACGNVVDGIEIDWTKTRKKVAKKNCRVIIPRGVHRNADQMTLFELVPPNAQEL